MLISDAVREKVPLAVSRSVAYLLSVLLFLSILCTSRSCLVGRFLLFAFARCLASSWSLRTEQRLAKRQPRARTHSRLPLLKVYAPLAMALVQSHRSRLEIGHVYQRLLSALERPRNAAHQLRLSSFIQQVNAATHNARLSCTRGGTQRRWGRKCRCRGRPGGGRPRSRSGSRPWSRLR